ncbi:EamA family transporter [Deltaproteobacteria bacterium Smac51]|nr:EamA family transporter [Deltaproteobacteria bacterium Smac51]
MDSRKAIDGRATGLMLLLCLIWGLQQVVIKTAGNYMTPVMQIGLRSGIAAVMVAVLIRVRGGKLVLGDGSWRPGLAAGLLFALEYLFVGEGLRFTTASHMVVLLYTAPIFAALGLHWKLPEERLKPMQWLGIAIAFAGIVAAFMGRSGGSGDLAAADMLKGDLLGLAGGLSWGATTVVARTTRLSRIPAAVTVLYQLITAFTVLMIAGLILNQTGFQITPVVVMSMSFQVLVVSFGSFLAWFWLLRNYLASRLGVLSFFTPLFGVVFGIILLDEPLEMNFAAGTILVFAGTIMVSGYELIQSRLGRK